MWACTTTTVGGQLVGVRKFEIVAPDGKSMGEAAPRDAGVAAPVDAGGDAPARNDASP